MQGIIIVILNNANLLERECMIWSSQLAYMDDGHSLMLKTSHILPSILLLCAYCGSQLSSVIQTKLLLSLI